MDKRARRARSAQLAMVALALVATGCVTVLVPGSGDANLGAPTSVAGVAEDPAGVDQVRVSIRDRGTGLWWNPAVQDWRARRKWFPARLADQGAVKTRWSARFDPRGTGASGLYKARVRVRSAGGLGKATARQFRVPVYELSELGRHNARYRPAADTIVTTSAARSKIILDPLAAAAPGGRQIEVELKTRPDQQVRVAVNWTDASGLARSKVRKVSSARPRVIRFDVSAMGDTIGPVRLRVDGPPGVTLRRISLLDPPPPNFVFILTDDLRADEIEMGFNRSLPGRRSALQTELIDQGATLPNFFTTTPLCCPSRASFLTGQYAHNHGVYGNAGGVNSLGGLVSFYNSQRDRTSLGRWLQAAGYDTALVGKYLNGYPNHQGLDQQGVTEQYVPRGWDEWYASFTNDTPFSYYDFRFNENGQVVQYNDSYLSTIEQHHAVDYIRRKADNAPFFLYINTYAPHGPPDPRPDHVGDHWDAGVRPPPLPACDEADLSDKPAYIRDEPDLVDHDGCWNKALWSERLDMTLATDDLIAAVVDELDRQGVLDNTYIIFASDNGFLRGEHHIGGKSAPYEESVRIPMIIRGPGIDAGTTLEHLVGNIDIAPTLLDLADAAPTTGSPPIDGESLVPVLVDRLSPSNWRRALLLELRAVSTSPVQPHVVPRYYAVRTRDHVYVEYEGGDTELYDLRADPYQLDSIHDAAPVNLLASLQARLGALQDCSGLTCVAAARSG